MHNKILNFRNVGNIPTQEGIIRPHYFYRGGPLHNLSDDIIETLQEDLKIKTVIDFRDSHEIHNRENHKEGFEVIHLNIIKDQNQGNANPAELLKLSKENPKEIMIKLYRNIINSKHSQQEYTRFFDIILHSENPVYFHCSAGKDRTGIAAALLLKTLGASNHDILEDYLMTNTLSKNNINQLIKQVSQSKEPSEKDVERIHALAGVHAEYLEAAYEEIIKNYESFDNYIQTALGLNEDKIKLLKEKFILMD